MNGLRSYTVFGLEVASEFELPELQPNGKTTPSKSDVVIESGNIQFCRATAKRRVFDSGNPDRIRLSLDAGNFTIECGERITVDRTPGVSDHRLGRYILSVLGFVLHQRELLVLHGSVICIGGRAVVFLGASGAGKSTTAALFLREGHPVVSDDIAAVQIGDGEPVVRPGVSSVRLPHDVAADLCVLDETEQEYPTTAKISYSEHERLSDSVPLGQIYVLTEDSEVEVEPLAPANRLMELVRNTYTIQLLRDTDTSSSHLRQCSQVAETVPVKRLRRPCDLAAVPELLETVEREAVDSTC